MKLILSFTLALLLVTQTQAIQRKLTYGGMAPPQPPAQPTNFNIVDRNINNLGTGVGSGTGGVFTAAANPEYSPITITYDLSNIASPSPQLVMAIKSSIQQIQKFLYVQKASAYTLDPGYNNNRNIQIPFNACPLNNAGLGIADVLLLPAADFTGSSSTTVFIGGATPVVSDLHIYFGTLAFQGASNMTKAYSDYFVQFTTNSRPAVGFIIVDQKFDGAAAPFNGAAAPTQADYNNVILRELLHVLGFDIGILQSLPGTDVFYGYSNPNGPSGANSIFFGVNTFYLTTPKVSQYARAFYAENTNVHNRQSTPLQNGFGVPFQLGLLGKIMWNCDMLGQDLMSGQGNLLTIFTLLFFQDTGMYWVDTSFADYFNFLKGQQAKAWTTGTAGCAPAGTFSQTTNNLLYGPVSTVAIHSLNDQIVAWTAPTAPQVCNQQTQPPVLDCQTGFVNGAPVAANVPGGTIDATFGEVFGLNSAAFLSTVEAYNATPNPKPYRCHYFTCNNFGNQVVIHLWNNENFTCQQNSVMPYGPAYSVQQFTSVFTAPAIITNINPFYTPTGAANPTFMGSLYCPQNIPEFCASTNPTMRCLNRCNGNGRCMKGMCVCNVLPSGSSYATDPLNCKV